MAASLHPEVVEQIRLAKTILREVSAALRDTEHPASKSDLRRMKRETRKVLTDLQQCLQCLVERN
jgi:hypothetical protein